MEHKIAFVYEYYKLRVLQIRSTGYTSEIEYCSKKYVYLRHIYCFILVVN